MINNSLTAARPASPFLVTRASRELHVVPKAAPAKEAEAAATAPSLVKNMALFLVSPFVGLAYILAAPIVGLAALGWMATRAAREEPAVLRVITELERIVG